ncbi:hypothetical protein V5Y59_004197 [Salmonella enterica]|nr:hypothetical protein [Salmonella enterica]EGV2887381.1 hypothetical protein [Salmonella enterica]EHY68193.1 hypothetical protein SEHO0A_03946 [Salmonella enterica subsp. houtenae str. ATCC BAA-1581]EID6351490.1 hypothetical protein [Salmonella enterica]EKM6079018.1 hypothetical protein [Salmonella enterica]
MIAVETFRYRKSGEDNPLMAIILREPTDWVGRVSQRAPRHVGEGLNLDLRS